MMNITLDEQTLAFYIYHPNIRCKNLKVLITDIEIDCTYYSCEYNDVNGEFNIWICPLNEILKKVVLDSKHFLGFYVKILSGTHIIHAQKFQLKNRYKKYHIKKFQTNQFDAVGPSYLHFFFGEICQNIDFSGVVIDAGANVGAFTLYAKLNGASRIYSVEPAIEPYFYLEKNFIGDESVIKIQKAFNNKSEDIKFLTYLNASVAGGEMTPEKEKEAEIHANIYAEACWISVVGSITIQDILKIEPLINLLKLDIEGAEYKVIESMDESDFKRINQLFVEFHGNDRSYKIFDILQKNGYTTSYLENSESASSGWIYAKR